MSNKTSCLKSGTTDFLFSPGKITTIMDGQWGSSGKGKLSSFIVDNCSLSNFTFVCNAFSSNASHTVVIKRENYGVKKHVFKHLNSCANLDSNLFYYIGHGASIDLESILNEIELYSMTPDNLMISPNASVITDLDKSYEKGFCDFEGELKRLSGTIKSGTTASGSGAARAHKVVRHPKSYLAKDVGILKDFLGNVEKSIMERLEKGECGLGEIAQGFPLSLGYRFYPNVTFRNCTLAAFCDDMLISPSYLGNVVINFRTYPIRINSKKYLSSDNRYLTWDEVQSGKYEYEVLDSYSGDCYEDQTEITWEDLRIMSGSKSDLMEVTTLTKLPRRVFTFSHQNFKDAIIYNKPNENFKTFVSFNFINHIDASVRYRTKTEEVLVPKVKQFLDSVQLSIFELKSSFPSIDASIKLLGTSEFTEDTIIL